MSCWRWRDLEETVSVPVLEYSPLLSDADLLEIIASARGAKCACALWRAGAASAKKYPKSSSHRSTCKRLPPCSPIPMRSIRENTMERIIDHARKDRGLAGTADQAKRFVAQSAAPDRGFRGRRAASRIDRPPRPGRGNGAIFQAVPTLRLDSDDQTVETKEDKARAEVIAAREQGKLDERYVEDAVEAGNGTS
jgi:hypothetical protein